MTTYIPPTLRDPNQSIQVDEFDDLVRIDVRGHLIYLDEAAARKLVDRLFEVCDGLYGPETRTAGLDEGWTDLEESWEGDRE
jgi:hypothetical protein